MDLIETFNLDQHKSLKYVETTMIELDHVLDEAGQERDSLTTKIEETKGSDFCEIAGPKYLSGKIGVGD